VAGQENGVKKKSTAIDIVGSNDVCGWQQSRMNAEDAIFTVLCLVACSSSIHLVGH